MAIRPPLPRGFKFAGVRCGLKNKRNDLGIILSEKLANAAGVTTTNFVRAASVDQTRDAISNGKLQAVVVNSGNANCCTGEQGKRDTLRMATLAAEALQIDAKNIAVSSTGIIGHVLNMAKVEKGIADASQNLNEDPSAFMEAILTTDLVEKEAWAETPSGVRIYGVCKGSGMMAPNMATMLAYVVTDAETDGIDLQALMVRLTNRSFNCMTVDTDTSTNDTFLLMANGASGIAPSEEELEAGLSEVCISLAKQIAKDGEGATKLIEVMVRGTDDPMKIARSIADSPLVKTAMFGCDPNWGRVMMAAGKAGVPFSPLDSVLTISASGSTHTLFEHGTPAAFDAREVSAGLKAETVKIELVIGETAASLKEATVYTCDLGYGYVRINAEYHT